MALRTPPLATVLAAALTVGRAAATFTFGDVTGNLAKSGSQSSSHTSSSSVSTVSASVKCGADTYASSYRGHTHDYITAVTRMVRDACSYSWEGSLEVLRDEVSGWAGAWASATADAAAGCTSKVSGGGKAQGCAISEAAAYAYEVAFAAAHATAAADAFAEYCSCNNAAAWAFADADLFLVLIADVFSQASSTACAADNEASSAAARTSCYASVAADTYAKALATANIAAECGYWQDAGVTAAVMAQVGSDLYVTEACSFVEDREKLTGASTAGSAWTRTIRG